MECRKLTSMVDEEIWKDVIDYEDYYQISSFGTIFSKERKVYSESGILLRINSPKKVKPFEDRYQNVGLNKNRVQKRFNVHRLVAIMFIPNPKNKPQVNHIDGNKLNNNVNNLEWCTSSENIQHSWDNGLSKPAIISTERRKEILENAHASLRGKPAHNKGQRKEIVHGTISGYSYHSCRCDLCKKSYSDYQKKK